MLEFWVFVCLWSFVCLFRVVFGFFLLLFLFALGLPCKWRPLPPDNTFHLRAAQSSALTNLLGVSISSPSPVSLQLQLRLCFNPPLALFAIMRYDHSNFSDLLTSFYRALHPLIHATIQKICLSCSLHGYSVTASFFILYECINGRYSIHRMRC